MISILQTIFNLPDNVRDVPLPGLRWAYVRRLEKLEPLEQRDELENLYRALRSIGAPPEWIKEHD
jgi:hypothetical protein